MKSKLPSDLQIPDSIKNISLPTVDETTKVFKEKCAKVSGSDAAYEGVEQGVSKLKDCVSELIDVEQLQKEIEAAQPIGELDTVFNKYES